MGVCLLLYFICILLYVTIGSFRIEVPLIFGLLICTLISESQGLEKSWSASNLRKITGPANLDVFLGLHSEIKVQIKRLLVTSTIQKFLLTHCAYLIPDYLCIWMVTT